MPRAQAIVLADHVYRDERTGKHVVAGTFHQISVDDIPAALPHGVGAYLVLTHVSGQATLGCQFLGPDHQVLLDMEPLIVSSEGGAQHLEISLELPRLPLPSLGNYRLRVTADGAELIEATIRVLSTSGDRAESQ